MRSFAPFQALDLREVAELLEKADEVVAMREIAAGEHDPFVVGLRHDVDNTLAGSLGLAHWEHEHGFRSTFFILHDSPYWNDDELQAICDIIVEFGHEIGIHCNAIATALRTGEDPDVILEEALDRLRGWGHSVTGVAAHGDSLCYDSHKNVIFVNDEMFLECARPQMGEPDRTICDRKGRTLKLAPRALSDFGLTYETYRQPRELYLSDSGGQWNAWLEVRNRFPTPLGQLHVLMHPCWWVEAFETARIT